MHRSFTGLILLVCLSFVFSGFAFALSVDTHEKLNEEISIKSQADFDFGLYLKNNLGFSRQIEEIINDSTVWELIRDGGRYEDEPEWTPPYVRSVNHFHNPLASLTNAGFSGIWGTGFLQGESALSWAQKTAGAQWPGGHYSWHDARGYYLNALTSPDKATREQNFAAAFRALGQLMHLVQDMSVPEHARDDGHYAKAYEEWVAKSQNSTNPERKQIFETALANPVFFDMSALRQPSTFPEAPVSIARLFDSNRYDGTNPEVTITPNIGLAEYTNANFLTGDTLFTSIFSKKFPYPSKATSVKTEDRDIPDPLNPGSTVKRPYYIKIADGETGPDGQGYRLAGVDYFHFYREQEPAFGYTEVEIIPPMDYYVFADCAKLLLPRAVGYSATLLQYFFRGQMEAQGEEIADPAGSVTELKVRVRNATQGEAMENGEFVLSYRYKPAGSAEYVYGVSSAVSSGTLAPPPDGCGQTYSFHLPQSIPADATEKRYTVVFKGTLGSEVGAVAGKVVEMAPVGFFEEWDAGLHGNHYWLTTDSEIIGQNPDNGTVVNEVLNGKLVKENIRYAGSKDARVNQTYIGEAYQIASDQYCIDEWGMYCVPNDFGVAFPVPVTPCTRIRVQIDEMSTTEGPANPDCGQPGSFQGLFLKFDNGISLAFTAPGQEPWIRTYYTYVQPGYELSFNIFDAFAAAGVEFVEPVNLISVGITQQMWTLCEPSTTEQRQRMAVDYIRLED